MAVVVPDIGGVPPEVVAQCVVEVLLGRYRYLGLRTAATEVALDTLTLVGDEEAHLGTFAPPLDAADDSVRGQLATRCLSRGLDLDLFVSEAI